MSSVRLVGAGLGAAILVFAWNIGRELALAPLEHDALTRWQTPAVSERDVAREVPRDRRLIDVYGNEVERAVTDYRVDNRGDLYERHSPQTAVPRLRPPIG
jgi:hypothetical protein